MAQYPPTTTRAPLSLCAPRFREDNWRAVLRVLLRMPMLTPLSFPFAGHSHCDRREQGRLSQHPQRGQAGGGDRLGVLRAAALTVSPHIYLAKHGGNKTRNSCCVRQQLGDNCQKLCNKAGHTKPQNRQTAAIFISNATKWN